MSSFVRWLGYLGTLGAMVLATVYYLLGQKFTLFTGDGLSRVFGWTGAKSDEYQVARAVLANVNPPGGQEGGALHWTETFQLWMVGLFLVGLLCLEIARRIAKAAANEAHRA